MTGAENSSGIQPTMMNVKKKGVDGNVRNNLQVITLTRSEIINNTTNRNEIF